MHNTLNRRATAHAADPRFHGNLRHEKKKGAKKKRSDFLDGGDCRAGCVLRCRLLVVCMAFWIRFGGSVLGCRLLFNWWRMGECTQDFLDSF